MQSENVNEETGVRTETGQPSCAPRIGSAIAHQNRRRVWEELEAIKTWTARLESELQKEPDGVIPWIQIQSISEATGRLLYAAGHVNALRLAGVSPNGALCDGDEPPQTVKSKQS